MNPTDPIAEALAAAFIAGPWTIDGFVDQGAKALGQRWRWLRPLARRVLARFPVRASIRRRRLRDMIAGDPKFQNACGEHDVVVKRYCWPAEEMTPADGFPELDLPALRSAGELAGWLDIDPRELSWFADLRSLERANPDGPLRHYRYRWLAKSAGSCRLIEVPKRRLKALQRRILHGILDSIPAHDAAHGFRIGRSILTFVAPHIERRVVLRLDLADFFPSICASRVEAIYRTAGYPEESARVLARLCVNGVPGDVLASIPDQVAVTDRGRLRSVYACPHLPQGAPTSPALANLCAYRIDCRLAALAKSAGAAFTRYADDLAFSGGDALARSVRRFSTQVAAIAIEEGFRVQYRKTRIMRQAARQRLAGIVVNARANVCRADVDRLEAILCNCARLGPSSQNRSQLPDFRAHLAGRIAHVATINPTRARRLQQWYERIDWTT